MVKQLIIRPNRRHEAELWANGQTIIAGIDEVGRGALAGPVVAAAVVLPPAVRLRGVRDSKLLNSLQRQQLAQRIKALSSQIGVGWATASEVDSHGLTWAVQQSGLRALVAIQGIDGVLLDGNHNYLKDHYPARAIIKADNCCLSVAAASIVAKVARDRYMVRWHQLFPEFGFDTNVGYGTRSHLRRLASGISPIHRRSYAPVKLVLSRVD